jgi:5-methylcytosine-specific restriction enzyme A
MFIDHSLLQSSYAERHRFHQSPQWLSAREWAFVNDHFCCRICKSLGIYTYDNLEVDHIIPIVEAPELCLDLNNLQVLCKQHHSEKTAKENGFGKKIEPKPYNSKEYKFS